MTARVDATVIERGRRPATKLGPVPILTGHFQAGPQYGCKRWAGTDDWLLFCTIGGAGRFGLARSSFATGPGELVLLDPRQPHDYATATPPGQWEFTWAHFLPPPAWLSWLAWPLAAPGVHRLEVGDPERFRRIAQRLREMDDYAVSGRRHGFALALNALEEALLLADSGNSDSGMAGADRILQAGSAVRSDLARAWSVAELANLCGLSASRFAHRFRAAFGEPPRRWIERQRIERARQLLTTTNAPIAEIAADVGFADPFHFSHRFRTVVGIPPSRVRRP